MTERTKVKRLMWVVTIDGYPVDGTNGYTRKAALLHFGVDVDHMCKGERPWPDYVKAGYAVKRVSIKSVRAR